MSGKNILLQNLMGSINSNTSKNIDHKDIIRQIETSSLPKEVLEFANEYETQVGIRNKFVWKWIYELFPYCTIDSVPDRNFELARKDKTLFTMFITILDDIAESCHDRLTFEQAKKIPFQNYTIDYDVENREALKLAEKLWDSLYNNLQEYGEIDYLEELFLYDIHQSINSIEYSLLITEQPAIGTKAGVLHYGPHNMVVFPYIDIDIIYSEQFNHSDISSLREPLWRIQKLARIGNWISTWEREIYEGDFSSGIIVWALQEEVIKPKDLREDPEYTIECIKNSNITSEMVNRWEELYADLKNDDFNVKSVDVNALIDGMDIVMVYHLISEGYK